MHVTIGGIDVHADAAPCIASGRAFGGEADDLLGRAVAIELSHNAFLVHDDIADGSEMRRGRPTLAASFGPSAALNAGDALAVVAGQVLRRATRRRDRDVADLVGGEFDTMAMRTLEDRRPSWVGRSIPSRMSVPRTTSN